MDIHYLRSVYESIFAKRRYSIFYPFFHSFSHTWRGAGNKKSSRHRTKGTEVEDHGWVSVAVYFSYFRREVWIFFFRGEQRAQVIWLTTGTATAGVFGPKAHSLTQIIVTMTTVLQYNISTDIETSSHVILVYLCRHERRLQNFHRFEGHSAVTWCSIGRRWESGMLIGCHKTFTVVVGLILCDLCCNYSYITS